MKNIIITTLVIVGVIGGAMLLSKKDEKKSDNGTNGNSSLATNHVFGNKDAKVKLVEYGDFECPGCVAFEPIVKQIREQYKDQISFQFKNFPLTQIHLNAQSAHRAAHAASLQGKFWEMHDKIYENHSAWRSSQSVATLFRDYAEELGLDMSKYDKDYASSETNDAIKADLTEGQQKGVNSTPTFFLNDKELEDSTKIDTYEEFSKLIQDAITEANQTAQQ